MFRLLLPCFAAGPFLMMLLVDFSILAPDLSFRIVNYSACIAIGVAFWWMFTPTRMVSHCGVCRREVKPKAYCDDCAEVEVEEATLPKGGTGIEFTSRPGRRL